MFSKTVKYVLEPYISRIATPEVLVSMHEDDNQEGR